MPAMNDAETMKKQYANADSLNVRMALHRKYSVNQQPFGDWISEHYRIRPGMKVLEVGCGTGAMWSEPERWLPENASLILTDFSQGMLEETRRNVPERKNISFLQADIQQLPFEDASFDLVIANMMLYHVPDLHLGLSEAARVLRPDGRFICATSGEGRLTAWLQRVLGEGDAPALPFSLQNGGAALQKHFAAVERYSREDALEVTDVEDLLAYVLSMASFAFVRHRPHEEIRSLLERERRDGVIRIPKEYGLFQCCEPIVTKIFD